MRSRKSSPRWVSISAWRFPIGRPRTSRNWPSATKTSTRTAQRERSEELYVMRHGNRGRKFSRPTAHRTALLSNLAVSLIEHEQIVTTLPKAKDLRPIVERLVSLAKRGDLHARRLAAAELRNNIGSVKKLF